MKKQTPVPDTFAAIAEQRVQHRGEALTIPEPLEPNPRELPRMTSDTDVPIPARETMRTEAALEHELERLRNHFAPFEGRCAPEPPVSSRNQIALESFDWRIETKADRRDFAAVTAGGGDWERVEIPHYGPPLGKAATYYRTEFNLAAAPGAEEAVFVCFKGVDYRAQVFVNGAFVGAHEGFFAPFEFDCTAHLHEGDNTLLVKVENDAICMGNRSWEDGLFHEGDKIYAATGPGYDDPQVGWHHCPPGMGVYQDVFIETRPRLHVTDLFVRPQPEHDQAEIWIEINSVDTEQRAAALRIDVFGYNFEQTVVTDVPGEFPTNLGPGVNYLRVPVRIPEPRLWRGDAPWLYEVQVKLFDGNSETPCDVRSQPFGMRSYTMDEAGDPKGEFRLNGEPIRLRGANTMGHLQQCVMHKDWEQLRDDILLCKACNMNFLRLTQRPVQPEIYEFCDRLGMMVQTDLPLFGVLRRNQYCEAVRQAEEMERLVRPHPCNIAVSYINEPFPNAKGRAHRHLTRPELESFFEAASHAVRLANPDRVIKPVDGDYDPPAAGLPDNHCYCGWYNGHGVDIGRLNAGWWQAVKPGWLYGCGEFGAEGLDPVDLMRRRYPAEWLPQSPEEEKDWMPDRIVKAQSGRFQYLWFENPRSLDGWVRETRAHQARVTKMMTEAFRRDRRMNSFAIHLSIDAFPAGWMKTIMDVERRPKPAYFAYRDACEPLMLSLRADRFRWTSGETAAVEAWICNDRNNAPEDCELRYRLEREGNVLASGRAPSDIPVNSSRCHGTIRFEAPDVPERITLNLHAALVDPDGQTLHDNTFEFEVFPTAAATSTADTAPVHLLTSQTGEAKRLCADLGIAVTQGAPDGEAVIVVDDFAEFAKQREPLESAAQGGATIVFLCLPPGEYDIAESAINVRRCSMNARHFVSRDTAHPLVDGFQPHDFRFWHDVDAGILTPFLHAAFRAEDWTPILTSGDGAFTPGAWTPTLAAAEKDFGNGRFVICQVHLHNRIATEPVAREFARRLLEQRR